MTIATTRTASAMWRDSGALAPTPPQSPTLAPSPEPQGPSRGLDIPAGLRRRIDRVIAASSLVATGPVLDMREFAWTALLRDHWRTIRDEAVTALSGGPQPAGRVLTLWSRNGDTPAPCPQTHRIVSTIPGLDSAALAILPPGAHHATRRGATKRLITCHLGLVVPRDGDVRMRVGDRVVRWSEGETLVFDDTYDHEVWNEASGTRIVLRIRFDRPLRNPGKWVADRVRRLPGLRSADEA
jgi:ornithine lipid ester-linked acyl 2-hydroxylase